ncbi:MAG: hypothetical protein HRU72_13770 [Planctomycetia bacterium]|nr:MAG: hypothetical protein HRU72_02430 [Planctomycetia bacterium]QOJ05653.1 MAG: hypothetical protein HRU72_03365 [Planctomycetia bacterium]QOJ05674.1 MAG: hypothetical protein HRU72_03470 [Planctomycetia bacterium]QOJ05816.1 MAG: hypothetical protein HRU72_04265 [Planctomycetia bacterium]QOJ06064.1 MAG: hypothetical protein HRU72_05630 [Planctomycetia bacterium]
MIPVILVAENTANRDSVFHILVFIAQGGLIWAIFQIFLPEMALLTPKITTS